ncbi:MAG: RNA-splicing factor [Alyxoria varia]|nr:MAG: RNA-splicing factor [Alyxoria varia]
MSANVGLTTPRGSGTSGYVQRNLSALKPKSKWQQNDRMAPYPNNPDDLERLKHRPRQPDQEILEHERKREVEVKVMELRDRLEEEGLEEDEVDEKCEELREKLNKERLQEHGQGQQRGAGGKGKKDLKAHRTHELAEAKIQETDRLRRALGISEDYEEGSHWRKQEERMREGVAKREQEEDESRDRR